MIRFIKIILTPICFIFSILPRWSQEACANFLGIIWFDVIRLRRRVVLENLDLAFPHWEKEKKIQIGRKSIQNLCLSFLEYLLVFRFRPEWKDRFFKIQGFEGVDKELQKGHGVLMVSLHLGAIDFAMLGYLSFGYKMAITSKRINNKIFDELLMEKRKKEGITVIEDRRNPFAIFRALKDNKCLVFIIDQFMGIPYGIPVKFFGQTAWTAAGPAAFSLKTNLVVYPVYNYRKNGQIILQAEEPIPVEIVGDHEQNIKHMTQKYNDRLEEIIRKYPEQWMWVHKRWKGYD